MKSNIVKKMGTWQYDVLTQVISCYRFLIIILEKHLFFNNKSMEDELFSVFSLHKKVFMDFSNNGE